MADKKINTLLSRLGDALTAGDIKAAATCFETPALILSEDGATAIGTKKQVEQMFAAAKDWYHSRGLVKTKPRGARIRKLSVTLSQVDVEWPSYDSKGKERATEQSHYIVSAPKGEDAKIRVTMSRSV
jgi:hypothetical protein